MRLLYSFSMRRIWFGFNPSVLPRTLVITCFLPIPGANYNIVDCQLPIAKCKSSVDDFIMRFSRFLSKQWAIDNRQAAIV